MSLLKVDDMINNSFRKSFLGSLDWFLGVKNGKNWLWKVKFCIFEVHGAMSIYKIQWFPFGQGSCAF